jgi:hypothetical protein
MEPEGSSPHSQAHTLCPNPELPPSSPHTHIPLPDSEPALYRLLTFHVPNLKSLFC